MKSIEVIFRLLPAVTLALQPALAFALPGHGTVVGGSASINQDANSTTINQFSGHAIIDWSSFNVDANESVRFNQPGTASITLNRILDMNPSYIDGMLSAPGQVWFVNRNGMTFGPNAVVNVGGLLATASDIRNDRFMSGDFRFDIAGDPAAVVRNRGAITVREGGLAALAAPRVSNEGVITARLGTISLASGDSFTLDLYGDGLINLQASDALSSQLVESLGTLKADGGTIVLSAAAAGQTVDSLINLKGLAQARSVGSHNGSIRLYAEGSNAVAGNVAAAKGGKTGVSTVLVDATLDVSGGAGETGGEISVLGDRVAILSGSLFDASGDMGGGSIRIGGDYQGIGVIPAALHTVVQSGARLNASAKGNGNGGRVILWSDDHTEFAGFIEAKGGLSGGDGGFVETSGKQLLSSVGLVDASSAWGFAGQWLLDPNNITIQTAGGDINVSAGPVFTSNNDSAIVSVASIEAALNAGTSVTVSTGTGGTNAEAGNITVANAISKTAGAAASLTLNAANSIFVNAGIGSTGNALNVLLNADADSSGYGAIRVNGATIDTRGGDITMTGGLGYARGTAANIVGLEVNNSTLNAGAGTITLNSRGTDLVGNVAHGMIISGSTLSTTGSGAINMTTTAGGNGTNTDNVGLVIYNTNTISTVNGDINLNGTGGNTSQWGYGIFIANDTRIQSTGSGDLTLVGHGGINGTSHSNRGIWINTNNTYGLFTNNGDLSITGTGTGVGGSSYYNDGVAFMNGSVGSNGNGNVTVQGTGGTGSHSENFGVQMTNAANLFATGGTITVTGQGGTNGSYTNLGVLMGSSSSITNTGSGSVTVNGTGGGRGINWDNIGIYMNTGGGISTVNGDITLNGTGGNSVEFSYGTFLTGNTRIASTGSGNISVYGTGGITTVQAGRGVAIQAGGASGGLHANTGDILVSGVSGQGNSRYSDAVYINGGVIAGATASSDITIIGDSRNYSALSEHSGTYITGSGIVGAGGAINITGYGGLGTEFNYGTRVLNSLISNTGNGSLTINGVANAGVTDRENHGVFISSSTVTTVNGALTVDGTGPGTAGSSYWSRGVLLTSAVASTGTGVVTVRGRNANTGFADIHTAANGALIGSGTQAGNIVLAANSFVFDWANNVQTTGSITVRPYADGATLGVGTGTGTARFTDTNLGVLTWGAGNFLTFGDRTTGAININTAATYTRPLQFMSAFGANDITLAAALNSTLNTGTAFVIASGRNFINGAGATPFVTAGARGLVYTPNNAGNSLGAWTPDFVRYSSSYSGYGPSSVVEANNGLLIASSGNNSDTIRFTADNKSKTQGDANPALTYTFFCQTGCSQAASTTGAPTLSTTANGASPVGVYAISINQNTLALRDGYEGFVFDFVAGSLSVNAPVPVSTSTSTSSGGGIGNIINGAILHTSSGGVATSGGFSSASGSSVGFGAAVSGTSGSSTSGTSGSPSGGGSTSSGNTSSGSGSGSEEDSGNGGQAGAGTGNASSGGAVDTARNTKDSKAQEGPEMDESTKQLMERLKGFFQLSFAPNLPRLLEIISNKN